MLSSLRTQNLRIYIYKMATGTRTAAVSGGRHGNRMHPLLPAYHVALLVLSSLILCTTSSPYEWLACPTSCHCDVNATFVNCSGAALRILPNLSAGVRILLLDQNPDLPLKTDTLHGLPALETLSLRRSNLSVLPEGIFNQTTLLRNLYLDHNPHLSLPDGVLSSLRYSLTNLSLGFTGVISPGNTLGSNLLNQSQLQFLDLSNISLGRLPAEFSSLVGLKNLVLKRNWITNLTEHFFESLGNVSLEYLDMSDGPLSAAHPEALAPLSSLQHLDLADCEMTEDTLENVLQGLGQSHLRNLRLSYVLTSGGRKGQVRRHLLRHLANTSLRVLHMEGNYNGFNGFLPNNVFRFLGDLEELYLADNDLRTTGDAAFHGLHSLKVLSLAENFLSCFNKGSCGFLRRGGEVLPNLETLDMSDNSIYTPSIYFEIRGDILPNLRHLKLDRNKMIELSPNLFLGLKKLQQLDVSQNPLKRILNLTFAGMKAMENLDITLCPSLRGLQEESLSGLRSLLHLNLNDNGLEDVRPGAFGHLNMLQTLNLRNNFIADNDGNTFFLSVPSNSLQFVDMGHNKLDSFPVVRHRYAKLHTLHLDLNHITVFNEDHVANMPALRNLDLSFNDILSPCIKALDKLVNLTLTSFAGNPFLCDCDLDGFAHWLNKTDVRVAAMDNHRCAAPADRIGSAVTSFRASKWQCQLKGPLVPFLSVICTLMAVFVFCLVVRSYRSTSFQQVDSSSDHEACCHRTLDGIRMKLRRCLTPSERDDYQETVRVMHEDGVQANEDNAIL